MEKYRFFNSTAEDEREYNASEFAEYFVRGYSNGVYRENGLITLRCNNTGTDMNTTISLGSAMIKGYLYTLEEQPLVLMHDNAHATLNRIDRIILRLDLNDTARNIKAFILKGTPNTVPTPPSLTRNSLIYEISLCQVYIPSNSATIPVANLTDERMDRSVCGVVSSQLDSEFINLEDYTMEVTGFDLNNHPIEVSYFTSSGLLNERTKLEDIDENGKYTTMYVYRYLEDGITIGHTKKWKLYYNENGFVIKKELVVA
jgi:hypothetical protein